MGDDEGGAVRLTGMIGVNASVVPGDSGGPLMNSSGEVIGMDTAGSAGATFRSTDSTQAYAIPITRALSIAKKVVTGPASTRVHIGGTAFMGVQLARGYDGGRSPGAVIAASPPVGPRPAPASPRATSSPRSTATTSRRPRSLTSSLLTKKPGESVTISYSDQSGAGHSVKLQLASGLRSSALLAGVAHSYTGVGGIGRPARMASTTASASPSRYSSP